MRIVIISALIGVATLVVLFLWWRFFCVARPEVPPLVIEPNDPLMQEAVQKAKDSIPPNRITETIGGGPRQFPIGTAPTARIGQVWR